MVAHQYSPPSIPVSLLYKKTGKSKVSWSTLACSRCKLPVLTKSDNIWNFLSTSHFPVTCCTICADSSNSHLMYLNSEKCYNCIPPTKTSYIYPSSLLPPNTTTLVLFALTFKPFSLHISTKYPTNTFRSSYVLPFKTSHLHTSSQAFSILSLFHFFHYQINVYMHWKAKGTWHTLVLNNCQF